MQHPEPQETQSPKNQKSPPTFTQICPKAPKPNRNTNPKIKKKPELHLKSKPKVQIKPQIQKKKKKLQSSARR